MIYILNYILQNIRFFYPAWSKIKYFQFRSTLYRLMPEPSKQKCRNRKRDRDYFILDSSRNFSIFKSRFLSGLESTLGSEIQFPIFNDARIPPLDSLSGSYTSKTTHQGRWQLAGWDSTFPFSFTLIPSNMEIFPRETLPQQKKKGNNEEKENAAKDEKEIDFTFSFCKRRR